MTLPPCHPVRNGHNWREHNGGKSFSCADCGLLILLGIDGYTYIKPGHASSPHTYGYKCKDGTQNHFLIAEKRVRTLNSTGGFNIDCQNCAFRLILHTHLTMATQDKPAKI